MPFWSWSKKIDYCKLCNNCISELGGHFFYTKKGPDALAKKILEETLNKIRACKTQCHECSVSGPYDKREFAEYAKKSLEDKEETYDLLYKQYDEQASPEELEQVHNKFEKEDYEKTMKKMAAQERGRVKGVKNMLKTAPDAPGTTI